MIVGPKKTLFMDEISTGLDSSTTFQIIKCLRDFAHLRLGTVFVSLLQPPPEVYNLFDDVLLLSEGWFCPGLCPSDCPSALPFCPALLLLPFGLCVSACSCHASCSAMLHLSLPLCILLSQLREHNRVTHAY